MGVSSNADQQKQPRHATEIEAPKRAEDGTATKREEEQIIRQFAVIREARGDGAGTDGACNASVGSKAGEPGRQVGGSRKLIKSKRSDRRDY